MAERQNRRLVQLNQPRPISVRANEEGLPVAVKRDRPDWTPVEVQEHWRIAEGWWREGAEVERDYYRLTTESGAVFTVYRDTLTDQWFQQPAGDRDGG